MKQLQQIRWKKILVIAFLSVICLLLVEGKAQAKKKSYVVTAKKAPCMKKYKKDKNKKYNKNTKQYYMLRSYLEKLSKKGGP